MKENTSLKYIKYFRQILLNTTFIIWIHPQLNKVKTIIALQQLLLINIIH